MAPLSKVSLVIGNTENASGPYSMLFINRNKKGELERAVSQEDLVNNKTINYGKQNDITKKIHQNLRDTFTSITQIFSDNVRGSDKKKRLNETIELTQQESTIQSEYQEPGKSVDISTYFTLNKSCENLLNDSTFEVKRRRTSNPKIQKFDGLVLRSLSENIEKPSSLPHLKCLSTSQTITLDTSTPSKLRIKHDSNFEDENSKRDSLELDESLGILTPDEMFLNSSHSRSPSLDYDKNVIDYLNTSKKLEIDSPRDDSLGLLDEKLLNLAMNKNKCLNLSIPVKDELQSPNLTDYSLGIIDEHILSNITMKTDTTVNMELPLDLEKTRMEQTPSPEELPLDPTPIVECDLKTEPTKSKTSNSFINSITSITSLDTGYQGDGEMSRPASRGADNSSLTRRPLPRPHSRRIDPMTDSDFYTESDADNHDENPLRGDRKAQVIDGTLYGVDPQAAADIYVNNRENMDSSGVFTDIESNTRNEDDFNSLVPDVSPSDTSSKTISENSQIIEKCTEKKLEDNVVQKDNPKKRMASSPGVSSPSSISSPRHSNKDETNLAKKYKMPKREVPSKVKAMLEPNNDQHSDKKLIKKPAGRWDAVMSKISKNEQNKTNLKEVKSKVFNSVNVNTCIPQRKMTPRNALNQKNPNSKFSASSAGTTDADSPGSSKKYSSSPSPKRAKKSQSTSTVYQRLSFPRTKTTESIDLSKNLIRTCALNKSFSTVLSLKRSTSISSPTGSSPVTKQSSSTSVSPFDRRRIRNRPNSGPSPKIAGSNLGSSIHSSLSDLSAATLPPTNKKIGSAKKRPDVVQVTQVLTANKLQPRNQQQTAAENKKNATLHSSPATDPKCRRTIFPVKEKKPTVKECTRGTVKGGRTSPVVRPPAPIKVPFKQPPVAEALAVLVQHLVFNVQAYQVPILKKQVEKYRLENEEVRLCCQQLQEAIAQGKLQHARSIEEERNHCRNDMTQLVEKHRNEILEITQHYNGLEERLIAERENNNQHLCKQHEEQLATLKTEFGKLQRTHEESLDILREENEAIREQIDEKSAEIEKLRYESKKLKEDYETKESILKEQNQKLKQQVNKMENDFEDRLKRLTEQNKLMKEENDRLLSYGDEKGISIQEVQSLRVVLELKQNEVVELRRSLAETTQKAETLVGAEEKARVLNARCEDLQLQLQRKVDMEKSLVQENIKLQDRFKEETNQKRRLSQYNEELQWKLKQNKEVISKVLEQAEETVLNRKMLSSSFNERHSSTRVHLERAMSFRDRTHSNRFSNAEDKERKSLGDFEADDISPPSSPKVKGIVEKSDSVSYVLEMVESPDVVANRIVRRSFRNSTTPLCESTPFNKSPSNKRPRIRNPLTQSSSSSAILNTSKNDVDRPRSASTRDGHSDNENVFIWSTNVLKYKENQDENFESSRSSMKYEDNLDLDDDNEEDLRLPALPSELDRRNGAQALPSPKHLAGEAMISESNSEDESTSSSQL